MSDTLSDVSVDQRIAALEQRIEFLEKERPGRRMKPNIVSKPGVCGLDPAQDSKTCDDASIYRYQQGCQGERCVEINRAYYAEYRAKKKKDTKPTAEAVVEEPPADDPAQSAEGVASPGPAVPPWASAPTTTVP